MPSKTVRILAVAAFAIVALGGSPSRDARDTPSATSAAQDDAIVTIEVSDLQGRPIPNALAAIVEDHVYRGASRAYSASDSGEIVIPASSGQKLSVKLEGEDHDFGSASLLHGLRAGDRVRVVGLDLLDVEVEIVGSFGAPVGVGGEVLDLKFGPRQTRWDQESPQVRVSTGWQPVGASGRFGAAPRYVMDRQVFLPDVLEDGVLLLRLHPETGIEIQIQLEGDFDAMIWREPFRVTVTPLDVHPQGGTYFSRIVHDGRFDSANETALIDPVQPGRYKVELQIGAIDEALTTEVVVGSGEYPVVSFQESVSALTEARRSMSWKRALRLQRKPSPGERRVLTIDWGSEGSTSDPDQWSVMLRAAPFTEFASIDPEEEIGCLELYEPASNRFRYMDTAPKSFFERVSGEWEFHADSARVEARGRLWDVYVDASDADELHQSERICGFFADRKDGFCRGHFLAGETWTRTEPDDAENDPDDSDQEAWSEWILTADVEEIERSALFTLGSHFDLYLGDSERLWGHRDDDPSGLRISWTHRGEAPDLEGAWLMMGATRFVVSNSTESDQRIALELKVADGNELRCKIPAVDFGRGFVLRSLDDERIGASIEVAAGTSGELFARGLPSGRYLLQRLRYCGAGESMSVDLRESRELREIEWRPDATNALFAPHGATSDRWGQGYEIVIGVDGKRFRSDRPLESQVYEAMLDGLVHLELVGQNGHESRRVSVEELAKVTEHYRRWWPIEWP